MAIYRVSDRWQGGLEAGYTIERISPGEAPVRLPFPGTRAEAQAEADRLNALAKVRTQWVKSDSG